MALGFVTKSFFAALGAMGLQELMDSDHSVEKRKKSNIHRRWRLLLYA